MAALGQHWSQLRWYLNAHCTDGSFIKPVITHTVNLFVQAEVVARADHIYRSCEKTEASDSGWVQMTSWWLPFKAGSVSSRLYVSPSTATASSLSICHFLALLTTVPEFRAALPDKLYTSHMYNFKLSGSHTEGLPRGKGGKGQVGAWD